MGIFFFGFIFIYGWGFRNFFLWGFCRPRGIVFGGQNFPFFSFEFLRFSVCICWGLFWMGGFLSPLFLIISVFYSPYFCVFCGFLDIYICSCWGFFGSFLTLSHTQFLARDHLISQLSCSKSKLHAENVGQRNVLPESPGEFEGKLWWRGFQRMSGFISGVLILVTDLRSRCTRPISSSYLFVFFSFFMGFFVFLDIFIFLFFRIKKKEAWGGEGYE